jgi:hypothetical protein
VTIGRGRNSSPAYIPSDHLIQRYSLNYSLDPTKLANALSEFGRLPETGQVQLIRCLVLALGKYQMLAKNDGRVIPSKLRSQLATVETTARKLLLLLGVKYITLLDRVHSERLRLLRAQNEGGLYVKDKLVHLINQLTFAYVETQDKDEATVNAELKEANDRVTDAIVGLFDLHKRAKTARHIVAKHITSGRGGSRHRPKPKGQLIRNAIAVYRHMRTQHPDSGNKPGYGPPLLRFVHAVANLYDARVRNADIHDAWRARNSKQK